MLVSNNTQAIKISVKFRFWNNETGSVFQRVNDNYHKLFIRIIAQFAKGSNHSAFDYIMGRELLRLGSENLLLPIEYQQYFMPFSSSNFYYGFFKKGEFYHYPTFKSAMQDKPQKIKLGRFLKKHHSDILSDEAIKNLVTDLSVESASLKFAWSANEIREVYRIGPDSCMSGANYASLTRFCEGMAPVELYGSNDQIGVAYLETKQGGVIARSLVVKDSEGNLTYTQIYPKLNQYECQKVKHAFEKILDDNTIKQDKNNLSGLKLNKIKLDNGNIVCPYLDSTDSSVMVYDDYIQISDKGYSQDHLTGCLQDYIDDIDDNRCICNECEELEQNTYYIEHLDRIVCEHCLNKYYTMAHIDSYMQDYCHNDNVIHCETDGEYYQTDYANSNLIRVDYSYYLDDDDNICYTENLEDYELVENCAYSEFMEGYIYNNPNSVVQVFNIDTNELDYIDTDYHTVTQCIDNNYYIDEQCNFVELVNGYYAELSQHSHLIGLNCNGEYDLIENIQMDLDLTV